MQTTARTLTSGDTVELGDVVESATESHRGGIRLLAVWDGEPTEYVVVTARFDDGDSIDVPDDGEIGPRFRPGEAEVLEPVYQFGAVDHPHDVLSPAR